MSIFLNRQTVTVKRYATGSYVNGDYVDGSISTITMPGSIQPDSADFTQEIKDLALEGRDIKGAIKVFTNSELFTADNSPNRKADRVVYNGSEYEIRSVGAWKQGLILRHYKSIGILD